MILLGNISQIQKLVKRTRDRNHIFIFQGFKQRHKFRAGITIFDIAVSLRQGPNLLNGIEKFHPQMLLYIFTEHFS